MARFKTPIGEFQSVDKPIFAELRATTKYFGKKAEELDIIEQMMGELYYAIHRVRPGFQFSELEQMSPEDIERIEDEEPESQKTEFVPDPLDDGIPTEAPAS